MSLDTEIFYLFIDIFYFLFLNSGPRMVALKLLHLDFTVRYHQTAGAPKQDKIINNIFNYIDFITHEGLF